MNFMLVHGGMFGGWYWKKARLPLEDQGFFPRKFFATRTQGIFQYSQHLYGYSLESLCEKNTIKLNQEELADKAGLHHTYVGTVENGEQNIALQYDFGRLSIS